jgi:hypothetical protein
VQLEINFWDMYAGQATFEEVSRMMFGFGYWLQGLYQVSMTTETLMAADIVFAHSSFQ